LKKWEDLLIKIEETIKKGKYKDKWKTLEKYKIPKWYKDAKFGIFIHWGVYSVPAFGNEWYPHNMYKKDTPEFKYHIETFGPHNKFGYKDFIPMFKGEKFNPEEWVEIFEKSGAKFVVPVAEHHDGFCMYESKLTKWNAKNMGPKRDIVKELEKEVRKKGLYFGISSHRAEHWWFFCYGKEINSDVREGKWEDFYGPAKPKEEIPDDDFLNDWLLRCCELVDKFSPDIFWFDWWINHNAFEPYLKKFAAYYYNRAIELGKKVVINYKYNAFPEECAVLDIERGKLKGKRSLSWQMDTSISKNSWCYIKNHQYKDAEEIIQDIVDVVSKNGIYLLNIGPKPDGTIPEYEIEVLKKIGEWLKVNGESIYGTRPWKKYGEGPTETSEGPHTEEKKEFTEKDIRFTAKEDTIYAIVLGKVKNGKIEIKSFSKKEIENGAPVKIERIEILGCKKEIKWERNEETLLINLPEENLKYPLVFSIKTSM